MIIDAERWDFGRHATVTYTTPANRSDRNRVPPLVEAAGGIEMKFHPQPATPLPLELLSAGNLAKKLALLDISPFFSFLLLPPPLFPSSFRATERYSTKEFCFHGYRPRKGVSVSRFGSDSVFRVFRNASRVLFNHDNSVLSTTRRRVGVFLLTNVPPAYVLSSS